MAAAAGGYSTEAKGEKGTLEYKLYFKDSAGNVVSPFHDIPLWVDEARGIANFLCEIEQGTQPKMEVSKSVAIAIRSCRTSSLVRRRIA